MAGGREVLIFGEMQQRKSPGRSGAFLSNLLGLISVVA
jgi:hypothetical protein